MSIESVIAIIGIIATMVIALVGGVVYLVGKISQGDNRLHGRVDNLRDKTMPKEDIYRALDEIKKQIEGIRDDVQTLIRAWSAHQPGE
jgi:hypothetical protein